MFEQNFTRATLFNVDPLLIFVQRLDPHKRSFHLSVSSVVFSSLITVNKAICESNNVNYFFESTK